MKKPFTAPRTKKLNRKSLENKADRLWSLCTIKRDKKCMWWIKKEKRFCGSTSKLSAHHIRTRDNHATRFLLHNSLCLCWSHHVLQKYRPQKFHDGIIDIIGQAKYDYLRELSEAVCKLSTADLREIVESLQRELDG